MLDGFPPTEGQAAERDAMLAKSGAAVTAPISLQVDDTAMVGRIAGRRTECGRG